jgi:hypothetical protein
MVGKRFGWQVSGQQLPHDGLDRPAAPAALLTFDKARAHWRIGAILALRSHLRGDRFSHGRSPEKFNDE